MDPLRKLLSTLPRLHSSPEDSESVNSKEDKDSSGVSVASPFTRQSRTSTPIPFAEPAMARVYPSTSLIHPPDRSDILRFRQHNGVNLSGIFVLDRTLFPEMFIPECTGDTELDAVKAHILKYGVEQTILKWESHWKSTMKSTDWGWLKGVARVTSVRIPIGFYTLGKDWCTGTEYEHVSEVYANAWRHFKNFTKLALENDIGIIVVLQAVPGGFGNKTYRKKSSQHPEVSSWTTPRNLQLTTRCLVYLASQIVTSRILNSTVIGIQLIDTPPRGFPLLDRWYKDTLSSIKNVHCDIPIYINDAGDIVKATQFIADYLSEQKKSRYSKPKNPIFLEIRRNFRNNDVYGKLKPAEFLGVVQNCLKEVIGNIGFIIGEWGSTFAGGIATHFDNPNILENFRQAFTTLQATVYASHPDCAGTFFYTYSMDRMPGHPVGYRSALVKGLIPLAPSYFCLPSPQVRRISHEIQQERKNTVPIAETVREHAIDIAFRDAATFFEFRSETGPGADMIGEGSENTWARKRWEAYLKLGALDVDQRDFEAGIIEGLKIWREEALRRIEEFNNTPLAKREIVGGAFEHGYCF